MPAPVISVCIPVYNVEPYLSKCLDSVLNQTFTDFEIIIVNDASPDNSEVIIKSYQKQDPRIRYYKHEKNLGPNAARKTAVSNANGDYLAFIDGDDFVEPDFLEKLHCQVTQQQAEVAVCNMMLCYPDGKNEIALQLHQSFMPPLFLHLTQTKLGGSLCNKLWHQTLFHKPDIDFDSISWGEDAVLSTKIFYYLKKIAIVDEPLYHYQVAYEKPNSSDKVQKEQKLIKNLIGEFFLHQELVDFFSPKGLEYEINQILSQREKQFLLYGEEVLRLNSFKGKELLAKLLQEFHGPNSVKPINITQLWLKSRTLIIVKSVLPQKIFRAMKSLYLKYFN